MRYFRILVALGVYLIVLAGCSQQIDTHVSAQVLESNLIDATITVQSNRTCDDLTLPNDTVVKRQSFGDNIWSCAFTVKKLPISDAQSIMDIIESALPGSTARLAISRNGSTFSVQGSLWLIDIKGAGCDGGSMPTICHTFEPSVTLTLGFPGKVTDGNGDIDGRLITWRVVFSYANSNPPHDTPQGTDIAAESIAVTSAARTAIIIGAGVVGLAVIVLLLWLVRTRRTRRQA